MIKEATSESRRGRALPELEDLGGGGLARYVQRGAFATGALRQRLLGSQTSDFRMVIRFAQVGKHQHLGRAIEILGEESRCRQV